MKEHGYIPTINYASDDDPNGLEWDANVDVVIDWIRSKGYRVFHKGQILQGRKRTPTIQAQTVAKRIKQIHELDTEAMNLEHDAEDTFGYVPAGTRRDIQELNKSSEKIAAKLLRRLVDAGYIASDEGATSEEAESGIFNTVDAYLESMGLRGALHYIGNGDWC